MKKLFLSLLILLTANAISLTAATDNRSMPAEVQRLHDEIRNEYAPDKRVATFEVDYTFSDKSVMLRGKTTSAEAKKIEEAEQSGFVAEDDIDWDNLEKYA